MPAIAPSPILQVLWTFVMWAWLYITRIPAIQAAGKPLPPESTAADLNALIPAHVRWKADNYNHLMEQPTLFYATVIIIALMGANAGDVAIAWGYVGLRIVHSIWQATVNKITLRFTLFILSTICLVMLAVHAFELTALHMGSVQ
jgi:hypothetical protein